MPPSSQGQDEQFAATLASHLTNLRLRVDLGELRTPAAFRAALEHGGHFLATDPRVREACRLAGLGRWLGED
ncbi:MAG: hypothetical protein ACREMZ_05650 [Gemmatimonadales bacterium]